MVLAGSTRIWLRSTAVGMATLLAASIVVVSFRFRAEWHYPFLHAVLEAFSSFLAGIIAWHLFTLYEINRQEVFRVWMALAFLNMGVLDGFHALVSPGPIFVWFHSCAVFAGGLFSLLIWMPACWTPRVNIRKSLLACMVAYPLFGLFSVWYPHLVPRMMEQGEFSLLARGFNVVGGLAFVGTSCWFVRDYFRHGRTEDLLYASCYATIGASGVLSEVSALWSPTWWWWHGLRFVSYGFIAYNAKNEFESGLVRHVKSAAQEAENQRFRLVVESAPCGMLMVNAAGIITLVNQHVEELFGYTRKELLERPVELLIPERFRRDYPEQRERYFQSPVVQAMGGGWELFGVRKDGREVPIEIGLTPIETDDGLMVMASIIDITERKRAEAQLSQQTAELSRSNSELEQFAYVASHDLQEPLRMVSSYCGLLARRYQGKLDKDADDFIHFAVDGATRMKYLIDSLLLYSRVGRGGKPFVLINSTDNVQAALANLKMAVEEAGAAVTFGRLPVIYADSVQLTQVFQNLIGNAVKFRGVEPLRVHISARCESAGRDPSQWVFSVQDNGIGFEQGFSERVFVIFQRLHTREQYPGNGMGLAITKKIVERHGGRIWVKSEPGAGTTFYFTLRGQPSDSIGVSSPEAVERPFSDGAVTGRVAPL